MRRAKRGARISSKVVSFSGKSSRARRRVAATSSSASPRLSRPCTSTAAVRSTTMRSCRARRASAATACAWASSSWSMAGPSVDLGDRLQLFALAEPVEAAGLAGQVGHPGLAEEPPLEVGAVAIGEAAGRVVALRALRREALRQVVAAEEEVPEPHGDGPFVLQAQEEGGGQVLVDLGLQLQLELGHRAVAAGAVEQIEEMAHLLGDGREGAEVRGVEQHPGVGARHVVADRLLEDHGQGEQVALLAHHGAAAAAREVGRLVVGDQIVGDGRLGVEGIQGLQSALHVDEELAEGGVAALARGGVAQWIGPSLGATGAIPWAASRAAARRLPVWIQRSYSFTTEGGWARRLTSDTSARTSAKSRNRPASSEKTPGPMRPSCSWSRESRA